MTDAQLALLMLVAEDLKDLYEHFENPRKARLLQLALDAVKREQMYPVESR